MLLTRARKGMVLFVPRGDATGEDTMRRTETYDALADHLIECGARAVDRPLVAVSGANAS